MLELKTVTAFVHPIFYGEDFFNVFDSTNLLEGDLIRLYLQILDRIGQIKKASSKAGLRYRMENCEGIIKKALEGIYLV